MRDIMLIKQTKSYLLIITVLLVSIGIVASCDTSNTTENEALGEENLTVATVVDGAIVQEVSEVELRTLVAQAYNNIPGNKFKEQQASFFNEVYIQGGGSNYYIIGKAKNAEGNCVSVATPLMASSQVTSGTEGSNNNSSMLLSAPTVQYGTTHTCTGDPCSSCSFTRDNQFKITGCDCGDGYPNKCNHTISE